MVCIGCRNVTRRLCKPQAISITTSDRFSFVNLNSSLTIRHRLIPLMTFSTTIRTLEMILFKNLSICVSSRPLAFFWVAAPILLSADSLEIPYLGSNWHFRDNWFDSRPLTFYRAFCLLQFCSNTLLFSCFHWPTKDFYRYVFSSFRCISPFVGHYLQVFATLFQWRPWLRFAPPSVASISSLTFPPFRSGFMPKSRKVFCKTGNRRWIQ